MVTATLVCAAEWILRKVGVGFGAAHVMGP